jgi:hypothetical protein
MARLESFEQLGRDECKQGDWMEGFISPVNGRMSIPEMLAARMVQEVKW